MHLRDEFQAEPVTGALLALLREDARDVTRQSEGSLAAVDCALRMTVRSAGFREGCRLLAQPT